MSPRADDEITNQPVDMVQHLHEQVSLTLVSKSSYRSETTRDPVTPTTVEKNQTSPGNATNFNWSNLSEDGSRKSNEDEETTNKDNDTPVNGGGSSESLIDNAGSLLQNFLLEHHRRNESERVQGKELPIVETEYVSLERLAETVSTCRVCNEKFRNLAQLDEHRSKAGHYQCNVTECANVVFTSMVELAMHKSQAHGAPLSPHISRNSPHVSEGSPHLPQNSPHMTGQTNSPHPASMGSPNTSTNMSQININSPLASPHHQNNSPTYNPAVHITGQQNVIPVNFEQLPAPVQQLAQQVQRMPLPNLPPGANTMIPGANYYAQPHQGRPPPMYRMPSGPPQTLHYPPHMMYSQYGPGPGGYPPMPGPPQMHPQMQQQMQQQMPRGRYPQMVQNPR